MSSFINYRVTPNERGNANVEGALASTTGSRWATAVGKKCRAIGVAGAIGLEVSKWKAPACKKDKSIAVGSRGKMKEDGSGHGETNWRTLAHRPPLVPLARTVVGP